ncbi:aminotransferase class V-fold PLP-dependent enzyme [Rubrivivax albus]|uniref:Aminotransferase class V-fold PLP-dependent enzyme n=1 Tax=Rubrivivax albus TaxID=2499835 RepID=A0A437JS23_9BURK|nr:aminotransferase class V-fold PLP-dependent enzyme [Rubrivivax albus]RVT49694.1 aminotransferase class V-fold PLP-dependent enzyme [Rubrivivax albus]
MRELFPLDPRVVFLNHGSFGACPHEVVAAQRRWQDELERNPVEFLGRRSASLLRQARDALGGFVGARADDLVFVPNATTAVDSVVRSLPLEPGDEVLATDLEYGACDAAWQRRCADTGATYRRVAVPLPFDRTTFVDALLAQAGPRTRVVFASHVTSTTALVLPVAELCVAARARGLLTLIDGAHAPGQVDLDLTALEADFYAANLHKWVCAPKGAGFLHARTEHHAMLQATVTSWGYAEGTGGHSGFDAYLGTQLLERRLQWQGTRDITPWLTVPAALDFHRRHLAPVREHQHAIGAALLHRVAARHGLSPIADAADHALMFPLPVRAADPEALRRRLFDHHRIEVPVTTHGGRTFVRVSVAGYTTEDELQALETALETALAAEH